MFANANHFYFSTLIRTEFLVEVLHCVCGTYAGICECTTEYIKNIYLFILFQVMWKDCACGDLQQMPMAIQVWKSVYFLI